MHRTSPLPIVRDVGMPVVVALAYGFAAALSLALTRSTDGIATMWPASGVLLAGLLRLRPSQVAACLLLASAASLVANVDAGNSTPDSIGFTLANMVEAMVGNVLLRRWQLDRPCFTEARDVGRFCVAAVTAAIVSAAIATITFGATGGAAGWTFAVSWFATVMLGMLIVAPLLMIALAMTEPAARRVLVPVSLPAFVAMMSGVAAIAVLVFAQDRYPLLFLPLAALIAVTYRLGPIGAAGGVAIVAVIAPLLTAIGHGPVQIGIRDAGEASFFLQVYLLTLFACALPFGALLAEQRRLAAERAESERMHRLLADSSTDVILRLSLDGIALYCSPAVLPVLGFTPEQTVGNQPIEQVHRDDRPAVEAAWTRILTSPTPETIVFRHRRSDGGFAWLDVAYRRVETDDGVEIVARARDITKRRDAELAADQASRRMRETNRLLGMAERAAQVGHWRLDLVAGTLFWSSEVFRMHGVPHGDTPDLASAIDFYHPDDRARVAALVEGAITGGEGFEFEARIVCGDGTVRHVASRGQPEMSYDGNTVALFGVIQDISRQVETEQALDAARAAAEQAAANAIRLVDTDALTGIASRRRTLAALDEAIETARVGGAPLALAIFDIDHFKSVNDRFGHPAGDAVLRRVTRAAAHAVRPTDLVGRLGGEEFAMILPGATAAVALGLADAVRRAVAASADGVEAGPPVTISIGVAPLVPGGSAASLLSEADRALYDAKESGRNAARLAA